MAPTVGVLPSDCDRSTFLRAFSACRAVLLRPPERLASPPTNPSPPTPSYALRHLRSLHRSHPGLLDETFTLERASSEQQPPRRKRSRPSAPASPDDLFSHQLAGSWYASFLVQKDSAAVRTVLSQVAR